MHWRAFRVPLREHEPVQCRWRCRLLKATFIRALESHDTALVIRAAIARPSDGSGVNRFDVATSDFALVPRSPFAYWVSDDLRARFKSLHPLEGDGRTVKVGLQTSDDFRFVR